VFTSRGGVLTAEFGRRARKICGPETRLAGDQRGRVIPRQRPEIWVEGALRRTSTATGRERVPWECVMDGMLHA